MNEAGSNHWHRADLLKKWMDYGGILIIGYTMYRNLSQGLRVRNKRLKKTFQECLIDPGIATFSKNTVIILRIC